MRDNREAAGKRDSSNLEIMRPDALPGPLESMTNLSIVTRGPIIEGQRNKRLQESFDDGALVHGIATPLGSEQQLRPHDRTERHVVGAMTTKTCDDWRRLPSETRNAGIRVE